MSFEYNWDKEDLKKELIRKRFLSNIILFIVGILLYIYFVSEGLKLEYFDNKVIYIYGIIFVVFLIIFLFLSTKLYVFLSLRKNDKDTNCAYGTYKVRADNSKIIVKINNQSIEYNYGNITMFKKRKKYFFLKTKEDKIGLIFKRNVIGSDNYYKLLELLNKNISC